MERPLKELKLPLSKATLQVVEYVTRRDMLELVNASDEEKDKVTYGLIIKKFNEEVDPAKIYEAILDVPFKDFAIVDDYAVALLPGAEEKKD